MSPCHEWTGARNPEGYGITGKRGHSRLAHRVAWADAHPGEPMPPVVRHRCDNPPCVNPEHLIAGTHADNARDCQERGRHRYAEKHHNAKLTDEEVASIRTAYAAGGVYQRELAARYGVTQPTISLIVTNRKRQHPAGALTPRTSS